MSDTQEISIGTIKQWVQVATGTGGLFSATHTCMYRVSELAPTTNIGHRLDGGDTMPFSLLPTESLWVFNERPLTYLFTENGPGYEAQFHNAMRQGKVAHSFQNYIELNCKFGVQHGFNLPLRTLLASATLNAYMVTGSKPIAVKSREYEFDGAGISTAVYRDATYTGGTPLVPFNFNDRNPVPAETRLILDATDGAPGTVWSPVRPRLGTDQIGTNVTATPTAEPFGLEYWFKENSVYRIALTSIDPANTQRLVSAFTFYEGFPDYPL